MPITPKEFNDLAKSLIKDKNYENEPGWRTAISRLYYGAFLGIRENMKNYLKRVDKKLYNILS